MEIKAIEQFKQTFSGNQLKSLVKNVETDLWWEKIGNAWIPITRNFTEYDSSYVVSPYAALIIYSKQEMRKLPRIFWGLSILLGPLSWVMKVSEFNKAISVNNWITSTSLFPQDNDQELVDRAKKLISEQSDFFITVRSLNYKTNKNLIELFQKEHFTLLPSRQVYFFDFGQSDIRKHINFKRDLKLVEKTKYKIVTGADFTDQDFKRAEHLHQLLYLEKYSSLNPAYTAEYFKLCHKTETMEFIGLKDSENVLQGFAGLFSLQKIMTVPMLGYNTSLPMEEGLYRILIAQALIVAEKRNLMMNLSAGASYFKRLRGGKPETEYSAIYYRHLPFHKRWGFYIVYGLFSYIGMPLIRLFKL